MSQRSLMKWQAFGVGFGVVFFSLALLIGAGESLRWAQQRNAPAMPDIAQMWR